MLTTLCLMLEKEKEKNNEDYYISKVHSDIIDIGEINSSGSSKLSEANVCKYEVYSLELHSPTVSKTDGCSLK